MRALLCAALAIAVLLPATAQDKPDDLVKAAVTAAGGAETLAKYPAGRSVGKGTLFFPTANREFTFEHAHHAPGRFRSRVTCEADGGPVELIQVADGAKARQRINGRAVPLTDAGVRELQLAVLLNEVAQLTPLTADRKFVLRADRQLRGPDATGLVVLVRGFPDLRLAFERSTGHLTRIAHRSVDPETGKEGDLETTFSEFKEVAGLVRPTRSLVTRDGRKVAEIVVEKFTPLERIDPDAFALPD
ncbi:unnamed protein product [Gemmataceae bacterium]|nr:unnamed protein product [Gemmataceae bacterium]VTT99502.1 unnamed protein product [Gemmataceae bacterium]